MTVVIDKSRHRLSLIDADGAEAFSCDVMLSRASGAKRAEGDARTPLGEYRVCTKNARSKYHLALGISYPNALDARAALREARISVADALRIRVCALLRLRPPWRTPLGGFVMIHGEHPSGDTGDWTAGCFAVRNADMDVIYAACKKGDSVIIREDNLK